jgi:RNA polymerase sigma-70 factor (ECF subfamily)
MPVSSAPPRPAPSAPDTPSESPPPSDTAAGRLSEAELEALRQRDPEAVRRHIYGNRGFLRSVLRRFTETEETARDLLQETFFQALRSLPDFRGESKLSTWLYSVAKNVALARYRDDKRRSPLEEETLTRVAAHRDGRPAPPSGEAPSWNPAEETTRNEEKALVHDALEELSTNYRQVIELRDLEELSTKETAERLGLTRVNVRVRLHRARKKLKEVLDGRVDVDYQPA